MITKKKFLLVLLIKFLFVTEFLFAFENKIILKVDNEIITSYDIEIEYRYLSTLNKNIVNLDKKKIFEVSKDSLIKEKIKKIEILKNIDEIKLEEKYINQVIENIYKKIGITNLEKFKEYLEINKVNYNDVINKISIEVLWNDLIYSKYNKKININEEKLRNQLIKVNKKKIKNFDLSEIFFEVSDSENLEETKKKIYRNISEIGFENTAQQYSISDSSKIGGKIGVIAENKLSKKIKDELKNMKINQISKPIIMPSGFLILKINNINETESNFDIESELKKIVKFKVNEQLNQFSNIYFNKIKKNIQINEL
jgi:peptidyl-prolyl cis-trans isomerase SurA